MRIVDFISIGPNNRTRLLCEELCEELLPILEKYYETKGEICQTPNGEHFIVFAGWGVRDSCYAFVDGYLACRKRER